MPPRKKSMLKRPGFRLGMIALLIIMLIALAGFGVWLLTRSLFSANNHFILRRVVVKSSGWWNSRESDICTLLKITKGKSNLFAINFAEAKKKLEKEPSIAEVSIYKILPDSLVIKISERIPRAFLHWQGNKIVVDSEAVVMSTSSCVNVFKDLPVITGFRSKPEDLLPGNTLEQVKSGLKLLELAADKSPEITIKRISLNNDNEYNTIIFDKKTRKTYTVFFPRKGVLRKLSMLNSVLDEIKNGRGKNAKIIDLRFKGQAVLK